MNIIVAVLIIVVIIVLQVIWENRDKLTGQKRMDYSFGLIEAKTTADLLKQSRFDEAEKLVQSFDPDLLTLVMDFIGLTFKEESLLEWIEAKPDSDASRLALGIFYNHSAWVARTFNLAKYVSPEQRNDFHDLQELSGKFLNAINGEGRIGIEAHARLIRFSMGVSHFEGAEYHFNKIMETDPDHLWAHVHYAEAIQPKWGGYLKDVEHLLGTLSQKRRITKYVTELKLFYDALQMSICYFNMNEDEMETAARQLINNIDAELDMQPLESPQKYLVYNYQYILALKLNNTRIENKYYSKMNGYFTLYPFGIMMQV